VIAPDVASARALVAHWCQLYAGSFLRIDVDAESGMPQWLESVGLRHAGSGGRQHVFDRVQVREQADRQGAVMQVPDLMPCRTRIGSIPSPLQRHRTHGAPGTSPLLFAPTAQNRSTFGGR
jgi:hypothetical protein